MHLASKVQNLSWLEHILTWSISIVICYRMSLIYTTLISSTLPASDPLHHNKPGFTRSYQIPQPEQYCKQSNFYTDHHLCTKYYLRLSTSTCVEDNIIYQKVKFYKAQCLSLWRKLAWICKCGYKESKDILSGKWFWYK